MKLEKIAWMVLWLLTVGGVVRAQSSGVTVNVPGNYTTIQAAIAASVSGDTILVAPGTYFENLNYLGKDVIVRSTGGPAVTTIDGGQNGSVVVFGNAEGPGATLDGFSVTNGSGTLVTGLLPFGPAGSGILVWDLTANTVSATIKNCFIFGNNAPVGAGVYCRNFGLTMEDCVISSNVGGAGIVWTNGFLAQVIRRCTIENHASGAGLALGQSFAVIEDTIIRNNTGLPGGVYLSGGAWATLRRCEISSNIGTGNGGGIYAQIASLPQIPPPYQPRFEDCLIVNNVAAGSGGALYGDASANIAFVGCTIAGNTATGTTGGLHLNWPNLTINMSNSIVWGNSGAQVTQLQGLNGAAPMTVQFSDIQGGLAGTGNINLDPLFVGAAAGDFHLAPNSPCVNSGTNAGFVPGALDIDGDPRVVYGQADIGADEATALAAGPALAGNVGIGAGGPFNVLSIDGTAGGIERRVTRSTGQGFTIGLAQPPTSSTPAAFAIFGIFAVPTYADEVTLPYGIGSMTFVPCPLLPSAEPFVFTLANSYFSAPCTAILPASPTPWTFGVPFGAPLPTTVTLQGIVDETPGVPRVTNGFVLEIL